MGGTSTAVRPRVLAFAGRPGDNRGMAVPEASVAEARDALVERLFEAVLGMTDVYAVYMGDRLGLYEALAGKNELEGELAAATRP